MQTNASIEKEIKDWTTAQKRERKLQKSRHIRDN